MGVLSSRLQFEELSLERSTTVLLLLGLCIALLAQLPEACASGSLERGTLVSQGKVRSYLLCQSQRGQERMPLVIALHGGAGTAEGMDRVTGGIARLAREKGFCVVFPQGIDRHWNDGRGTQFAREDDIEFISLLIDKLVKEKGVDPQRVYATGISNGGFFAQYLALKLPDKIAAAASVAASVPVAHKSIACGRAVPILFVLGTDDPLIPYTGGRIGGKLLRRDRGQVLPAHESIALWVERNRSSSGPHVERLPDLDRRDGSTVKKSIYGAGTSEVVVYTVEGGGHTWPSGWQYLHRKLIGSTNRDIDGNKVIWEFFSRHRLPASARR